MTVRIVTGDALSVLRTLESASVQCVVTSPPYYSLRAYSTAPQVWGGDPEHEHEWTGDVPFMPRLASETQSSKQLSNRGAALPDGIPMDRAFCPCGAWRGELGSEPTPALFIEHLVSIFDEVKRVLRTDGVCFVNIGDSYWTRSAMRQGGNREQIKAMAGKIEMPSWKDHAAMGRVRYSSGHPTLKDKDLTLIPERFVLAMQDAGWYVRSRIAWCKASAMPESVRDRPTSAWEHVWMFTKSARYFYDAEAVRQPNSPTRPDRIGLVKHASAKQIATRGQGGNGFNPDSESPYGVGGANLRNYWLLKDSYEDSAHLWTEEQQAYARRVLTAWWDDLLTQDLPDSEDLPSAPWWLLGPEPSREQHYAAYPTEIPRRCILAGTSERGACPACGAPWVRVVERAYATTPKAWKGPTRTGKLAAEDQDGNRGINWARDGHVKGLVRADTTTGWAPSCRCSPVLPPRPCVVLDPFLGSGTTALVADRLGRDAIGIELSSTYAEMALRRIASDAPMLTGDAVTVDVPAQINLFEGLDADDVEALKAEMRMEGARLLAEEAAG